MFNGFSGEKTAQRYNSAATYLPDSGLLKLLYWDESRLREFSKGLRHKIASIEINFCNCCLAGTDAAATRDPGPKAGSRGRASCKWSASAAERGTDFNVVL